MPVHLPPFDDFLAKSSGSNVVPVYRRLIAEGLTPTTVFAALHDGTPAFLFESVVGGERIGRYSFVGVGPFRRFSARGRRVTEQIGTAAPVEFDCDNPLSLLEERIAAFRAPAIPELPRFTGGAVGYAGYDAVRYVEHLPNAPEDDRGLPDLRFDFFDRIVIFDHTTKTVLVVALAHESIDGWKAAYERAAARVDELVEFLRRPSKLPLPICDIDPRAAPVRGVEDFTTNYPAGGFQAAVRKAKEYILAGDIFQVVLSQRFRTETAAKPYDIYRALRVVNPSPFLFFLQSGEVSLVGASPEILCRVEQGTMTVRPLAGTRRRGTTPEADAALAKELLADPKERSEHIMLVDLGRNDVGKVCERGSVVLADLMTVERYSHVMHISSTVTGTLAVGQTAFDALRSALPAGTLSGAPKVRAMQIIDELEPHRRGPYGGAVGYIDFAGNMDTCIALRTMVITGTTADVQAGAGIVAESDPDEEYRETVNKAMALLRSLEIAETQLAPPD